MQPVYTDTKPPARNLDEQPADGSKKMTFVVGDEKKLAEILASHKGKVVFVDYWAIWCESCVEFFPHTVEMHNKYKGQGLATIAANFDLLEDEAKVRKFLADQKADFDNLMSNYDDIGQDVAEAFEWSELPQFRLYDRTGKMRYEWKAKPEDLEQRIQELLAEK
jgi:thiol-disulfide isomerase/thioredoxin